jgi:hypothetical protein
LNECFHGSTSSRRNCRSISRLQKCTIGLFFPAIVESIKVCRNDPVGSVSELDLTHSLVLLAAIEALFRVDFERRCSLRLKDDLSRTFRDWKRSRGNRIRFEEDLLEAWKKQGGLSSNLVSDIRGAMKLRHWLAHGRYWTLKSGRQYDFEGIAALAEALEESRYFQIGRDEMK